MLPTYVPTNFSTLSLVAGNCGAGGVGCELSDNNYRSRSCFHNQVTSIPPILRVRSLPSQLSTGDHRQFFIFALLTSFYPLPVAMAVLQDMPSDVLVTLYTQLSSFSDVFALAATCRYIRDTWCDRTTTIYRALAPREIGYLHVARQLLEDQGGAAAGASRLCADDVRRMVRNAHKADKSAGRFGREIAARTTSSGRGFYYNNYTCWFTGIHRVPSISDKPFRCYSSSLLDCRRAAALYARLLPRL